MLPFFFFKWSVERCSEWQDRAMLWITIGLSAVLFANSHCALLFNFGGRLVPDIQGPLHARSRGEEGCLWCLLRQQAVGNQEASGRPDQGVWLMEVAGRGSCLVESPWGHALLLLVRVFGLNLRPAFTWTQVAGRGEDIPPRNKGRSP